MLRAFLCSTAVLALCVWVQAADQPHKDQHAKQGKHHHATVTNVNPQKGTITLRMKNREGKDVERTFHLTEDVEYLDSTGRVAQADLFQSGDYVLVLEREGRINQVKKENKAHQGHQGKKTQEGEHQGKKTQEGQHSK
jgi:hypothetical protein